MLEKAKSLGYTNCGFILDRGYFSKGNIHYMDRNGYEFIMMVKGRKSLVRQIIDKNRRTFEDKWENHISPFNVYGITVEDKLFDDDTGSRYFHLYFSSAKYAQELSEIEHRIEKARVALEKTCKARQRIWIQVISATSGRYMIMKGRKTRSSAVLRSVPMLSMRSSNTAATSAS